MMSPMAVLATVTPTAYWSAVVVAAALCAGVCWAARRWPGRWRLVVARVLGTALVADAVSFVVQEVRAGTFSPRTDLPLALCDMGVLVAATACWTEQPLLVEITYFWGLAGTLQGLLTPDLNVGFPHLVFWQYVVGHAGIVLAAVFLVVGLGHRPRPRAVPRIFGVTLAYTAVVGTVDGIWGANYMFLRRPPGEWTLLRVLGPWPWYIASAAGVALVLLTVLDLPFWPARRRAAHAAVSLPQAPDVGDGPGTDRRPASPVPSEGGTGTPRGSGERRGPAVRPASVGPSAHH
jgi:hypothetical integral membrane protein (TIGR02206 family)